MYQPFCMQTSGSHPPPLASMVFFASSSTQTHEPGWGGDDEDISFRTECSAVSHFLYMVQWWPLCDKKLL